MRTVTVEYQVAKFEELNEEQKQKVIENYYDINTDYDCLQDIADEYKNDLELLGFSNVKIHYSISYSQGDGACFTGQYDAPKNKTEAKKRFKTFKNNCGIKKFVDLAEELVLMNFKNVDSDDLIIESLFSRYCHSDTVTCYNKDLEEWAKRYMNTIYRSLKSQMEYLQSEESIIETIECNGYEFNINTLKIA